MARQTIQGTWGTKQFYEAVNAMFVEMYGDKLDKSVYDQHLISAVAHAAAGITVTDSAGNFTATKLEPILAELAAMQGDGTGGTLVGSYQMIPFIRPGVPATGAPLLWTVTRPFDVQDVEGEVEIAPTGSALICHLMREDSGGNLFNAQTISFSANSKVRSLEGLADVFYDRGDRIGVKVNNLDSGGTARDIAITLGVLYQ